MKGGEQILESKPHFISLHRDVIVQNDIRHSFSGEL